MIPKVIHYCWFGGKALPQTARKCLASWKKVCPTYEIERWDENNFDVHQHPFIASAYEAGAWAFVSDWARLKILYDNGGIYLDTDVQLLKPLDTLLENDSFFGIQQFENLCNTGLGFGCAQGNEVVGDMLREYDDLTFTWEKAKQIACPYLNDKVVRKHGFQGDGFGEVEKLQNIAVYPCRFFDPIALGNSKNLMCDDTISVSLYANSWGSKREKVRRSLINLVGTQRVEQFKGRLRGQGCL